MPRPLHEFSAIEAAEALTRGEVTSGQLVQASLARIDANDGDLQAWVSVDRDRALADARATDRMPRRSRLHGVPIGIKDIIDTADYETAYGSPIYAGYRPRADAACVSLLKQAGCVVLGKTVTTEFANITPARTRNPHDLQRSPGGSSSGSAAGVADFMVPLALGTQTAGSAIRPASYCGVHAIKPTYGAISTVGVKTLAQSLDTVSIFARTLADLALLLEILSGWPARSIEARAPRIGVWRTGNWHLLESDMAAAFERSVGLLIAAGADVFGIDLPPAIDQLSSDHATVMGYESARALAWELRTHPDKISQPLKQRLEAGWQVTRQSYDAVLAKAAEARVTLSHAFSECDFIFTPSCAGEAPVFGSTGDSIFNRGWTLTGNPCVAVPVGKSAKGLPLGVQLVGAMGDDMALLAWADWLGQRLATKTA
jgi:Asp-tRNA(Asn)/Glu-tRNA(Gln) amidotransferase A subunit family amidase